MSALIPPYSLEPYPFVWECPPANIDRRHLYWLSDVLSSGLFQNALEIGCLDGASSTAFVNAINCGRLERATFCDLQIRNSLRRVLSTCDDPSRVTTFEGRSVDMLTQGLSYDFVFVDGDHGWETVAEEVEWLLKHPPICVMAHDTGVKQAGIPGCEGPPYLKWRFQTTAPYWCLEESAVRHQEATFRGMFLATTSPAVLEVARESLRRRGTIERPLEKSS